MADVRFSLSIGTADRYKAFPKTGILNKEALATKWSQ